MCRKGTITLAAVGFLQLLFPQIHASERWQINMTESVTDIGKTIFDIHMLVFWICFVTGILVLLFMLYTLIRYRRSRNPNPASFHENTLVEIIWTVVPGIILLAMAWPASLALIKIYDTSESELDILVTGYQWKWKYEYLLDEGENLAFFSVLNTPRDQIYNLDEKNPNYLLEVDNPLVLPANKKIRFLITANDVIHAWWVPDLAVKRDAIPGFINETWSKPKAPGIYRGQCAELCGKDHGFMPIVVDVRTEADFNTWLAEKQQQAAKLAELSSKTFSLKELYAQGERVYQKACLACHGAKGEGGVGNAIKGSKVALGAIKTHLDVIINGVPGSAMQAFGSQLSDLDVAAVTTYQRNAFGNNTGDTVQPVDVYHFNNEQ